MKRTRVKRQSDKRRVEEARYRELRQRFLSGARCWTGNLPEPERAMIAESPRGGECSGWANEVHHTAGREGERLNDVRYWMALCSTCHRFATLEPGHAYRMGLSQHRNGNLVEVDGSPGGHCAECNKPRRSWELLLGESGPVVCIHCAAANPDLVSTT